MKYVRSSTSNSLSLEDYFKAFSALEITFVFLYIRYISTFNLYGGRLWKLLIITFVLGVLNLLTSVYRERNYISLLTGTSMPLLLYEALSMWIYSNNIRKIIVLGSIASLFMALLWAFVKTTKIKKASLKHKLLISKSTFAIRLLLCLVLTGACVYGKYLIKTHHTVSTNEFIYEPSSDENGIPDYENSLAANIETVAKLEEWMNLTVEEKIDVLGTIIRIECRYLGMTDKLPALEFAYLEKGLLGQYNHKTDIVTLSYNYMLSNASGYSIVQVLCHELYHRYQYYLVEFFEVIETNATTEKFSNLLLLTDLVTYQNEMANYVSPDGSDISFYMYSSQQLEQDAEKYSNSSVVEYYHEIQNYLN